MGSEWRVGWACGCFCSRDDGCVRDKEDGARDSAAEEEGGVARSRRLRAPNYRYGLGKEGRDGCRK